MGRTKENPAELSGLHHCSDLINPVTCLDIKSNLRYMSQVGNKKKKIIAQW